MVRFEAVQKTYLDGDVERRVLEGMSFEARSGESLAIVGPSGSGKTTILNLAAGLDLPDAGMVLVQTEDGQEDVARLDARDRARFRRRSVGYIFQFFNLVPTLTVLENVRLPLELSGRSELAEEAFTRLETLGLGARINSYPGVLSGGEQQRVAIARALAHRPALILADEPTGNLDADHAAQVADMLFAEVEASGATLLLATHSDRVAARARGRLALR